MTRDPAPGDRLSDYDYHLPPGAIAERPAARRDESRLLVVPRGGGALGHRRFRDLVDAIAPGDLLVVNQSRVLPARLRGRKPTGAPAEVLLLNPRLGAPGGAGGAERDAVAARGVDAVRIDGTGIDAGGALAGVDEARVWEALVRPGSKLKPGRIVEVGPDLRVEILGPAPGGGRVVRLDTPLPVADALERYGHVPLPPYIEREDDEADRERYQTVYATTRGSIAAPTAGLHFTPELLSELESRGVGRTAISLHVGVGTFRPVEVDDPSEHTMHAELYHVPDDAARAVSEARARGGRVWAVGTTVVRTLESVATPWRQIRAGSGSTDLFIRPPFDFRVVDGLITNFHLPRSTLLMLVSAFAGREATLDAYRAAVREGYRFYSYGDAMVVLPSNHLDGRTT